MDKRGDNELQKQDLWEVAEACVSVLSNVVFKTT